MFKGLGNIASVLKQASEFKQRMEDLQEGLGRLRVEGNSGGGMVVVAATGQQRIVGVQIDSSLFQSGDQEMLEDLLVAATNQALDKARQAAADEMAKLTGGLDLPGMQETLSKLGLGDLNSPE